MPSIHIHLLTKEHPIITEQNIEVVLNNLENNDTKFITVIANQGKTYVNKQTISHIVYFEKS